MHHHTSPVQWAVEVLHFTAILLRGSGHWNSWNTLPHCKAARRTGNQATRCHSAWGQWAVGLLQLSATLLGGSGQGNSCNALPHRLGAVGIATLAMHYPNA